MSIYVKEVDKQIQKSEVVLKLQLSAKAPAWCV